MLNKTYQPLAVAQLCTLQTVSRLEVSEEPQTKEKNRSQKIIHLIEKVVCFFIWRHLQRQWTGFCAAPSTAEADSQTSF